MWNMPSFPKQVLLYGLLKKLLAKNSLIWQLKKELEKAQQDLAVKRNHDRDAEIQTKNELIRKLREIIYSRVYPEMANLILQKEGIFESVNKLIMPEAIDAHMMTADQEIKTFRSNAVNELLSDFDER